MIKFTEYFYKFKDMLLDSRIPVEYRAFYLEDKTFSSAWRKRYNYNMWEDDTVSDDWRGRDWRASLSYVLHQVTIKDVSSIMDFDLHHPEVNPTDLIIALILWGRGVAIVKKVLELNADIPEYDELMKIVDETKRWNKEKHRLPKKPTWFFR